jgi:hypothetical protein
MLDSSDGFAPRAATLNYQWFLGCYFRETLCKTLEIVFVSELQTAII